MSGGDRRRTLAVVAARGGSKGIPRKNLIDLCGKPLIAWTVLQAAAAHGVDVVAVSSDSEEILAAAEAAGASDIARRWLGLGVGQFRRRAFAHFMRFWEYKWAAQVAEVVTENAYELFAQFGRFSFIQQVGFARSKVRFAARQTAVQFKLRRDQLTQQLKRTEDFGPVQIAWFGIDGAQCAPDRAVGEQDRRGDVAPEPIHGRRRVIAKGAVGCNVVDDDGRPMLTDLVADRGFNLELAARREAEIDVVANRATHPL